MMVGSTAAGSSAEEERSSDPGRAGDDRVQDPTHPLDDAAELGIDGLSQVAVVGSGGSSTVYRARQDALDRTVAVKVVHAAWSMEIRERFDREREVTGHLSGHAAIVPIFETGITRRGEPYLLMPFYERGSLFTLMRDRGPLPWREATFLVEALAATVADCHADGIVHRDVKPGNVMLSRHAGPRLADFGITLPDGTTTDAAAVAYTPSYSPPEAFGAGVVGTAQDVYALGATLWTLLAGRPPHTEQGQPVDQQDVLARAGQGPPASPAAGTPVPVLDVINRSMAPEPTNRPADGAAFAAELRRAIRRSDEAETTAPGRVTGGEGGNHRLTTAILAGLVAAGVLLIAGGLGWLVLA